MIFMLTLSPALFAATAFDEPPLRYDQPAMLLREAMRRILYTRDTRRRFARHACLRLLRR